ncbi:peptidylprolyl isomerase [Alcaligenes sp. 1735tsa3]|uniref:peptidylprolyl isomerase n=1 Tax=Alcaligenes sp. 1735tsa3 TaxID=2953809 RepID=UPI0020A80A50|nr:peptidylprolyl isomerase [Alcaligenes sp. 1735tsa3]USY25063.1 peptidylprolyl isomerase [Alcaligenes sp. 1735tsa3]
MTHPKFLLQSVLALSLSALLVGCGKSGDAQAQQPQAAGQQSSAPASRAKSSAATPAVATLGQVVVSQDELQQFLQVLPAAQREAMRNDRVVLEQWLRSRLAEKAVVEQAKAQEWDKKAEIRSAIEEAQNQVILRSYLQSVSEPAADYPSEQDLQTAYQANQDQFQLPAMYRLSQIFLSVPDKDEQALAQAKKRADAWVKQMREGKADFAALAKEHSDEKISAERGGDNGFLPMSQLVPAMRATVAKLEPGQLSDPIVQADGVHILQLTDLRPASVRSLEEVKPALRDALRRQRQQEATQAYVAGMLDADTVSVDGKVLSQLLQQTP